MQFSVIQTHRTHRPRRKKFQLFDYPKTLLATDSVGDGASAKIKGVILISQHLSAGISVLFGTFVGNKVYLKVYNLNQLK